MKVPFLGLRNAGMIGLLMFMLPGCNQSHLPPRVFYGSNQPAAYFPVSSNTARHITQKPKSPAPPAAWYSVKEISVSHIADVAMNDHGQIIVSAFPDYTHLHHYLWQAGMVTELKVASCKVVAGNNLGEILLTNNADALLWKAGKVNPLLLVTKLPLNRSKFSPVAINDNGLIVGEAYSAAMRSRGGDIGGMTNASHVFLWQAGKVKDLGAIPSATADSEPHAINNKGQIVGDSGGHAFLWQRGRMTDLKVLPGYESSSAIALNDKGEIVGVCKADQNLQGVTLGDAYVEPCLWKEGQLQDLGTLSGHSQTQVIGIDAAERVIGTALRTDIGKLGNPIPLMWHKGNIYDLNDLIPMHPDFTLVSPRTVNQCGQIVCEGFWNEKGDPGEPSGDNRFFLLTPTPAAQ